jgi:hypothetical protein
MNSTHTALFSLGILLLGHQAAIGQAMGGRAPAAPRNTKLAAPSSTPTVTILSAPTGASVLNLGAGNASLNLGPVSYFKGTSAPGESSQRNSGALVITTWFALRVDCPGSSPTSTVIVTMSRLDTSASHGIAIDGTAVGSTAQTLEQSMVCGSSGAHRLDMQVPVSTPAGSIGSNIMFLATLKP